MSWLRPFEAPIINQLRLILFFLTSSDQCDCYLTEEALVTALAGLVTEVSQHEEIRRPE